MIKYPAKIDVWTTDVRYIECVFQERNIKTVTVKRYQYPGFIHQLQKIIEIFSIDKGLQLLLVICRNDGCEAVVMQEYVDKDGDTILVKRSAKSNENIRRIGDEFSVGDRVFETGMRITPPVMGMLATLGYAELDVYRQPKVSVIVTGNELMPLTTVLQPGQIHESNSYALNAALNAMGVTPHKVVRVIDDKQELKDAFGALIDESDVVISVGGISVGDFDFVKDVVDELDVETIFYKIAMKPGKPNYFGRKGDTLIFGLPGNPVSVMVSFYMYPRVAINRMSGLTDDRTIKLSARLQEDLKKKVGRISLIRGVVGRDESGDLVVSPTIGQGSHKMSGLAHANCFIHFPKDKRFISKDSQVEVELIHWSNL